MLVIRESCIPPTTSHHAKRIVNRGKFKSLADKPELTAAKSFWDSLFLPHRPERPMDGPLVLSLELTWPHTKQCAKKLQSSRIPMDTGVDLDNMGKTITDALVRCGFLVNDSRVCELHIKKFRGPLPGVFLSLGEVS